MKCPTCESEDLRVLETRDVEGENVAKRRRKCNECGQTFYTLETITRVIPQRAKEEPEEIEPPADWTLANVWNSHGKQD